MKRRSVIRLAPVARVALGLVVGAAFAACKDTPAAAPAPPPPPQPLAAANSDATPPMDAERVEIARVEVRVIDPSSGPAREVYPRILAQRFGASLTQSPWFLGADTPTPPGLRRVPARVELTVGYDQVSEGSDGRPAVLAVIEAAVAWEPHRLQLAPTISVLAERPYDEVESSNLDGLVAAHVERAVANAAAGLVAKEQLRVGPAQAVIAALRDEGPVDQTTWALVVARERVLPGAAEPAMALLQSSDDAVRDAAIGTLIALRDQRAVAPLTRLADFQDYELMRVVIEAVGSIGGGEARDYLEFVSTGHPDDDIRAQAGAALARLEGRER